MRPDIINRNNSSSHPLKPGRFYSGIVKSVSSRGAVNIHIAELGCTYENVIPLNTTSTSHMSVGDVAKCTFTDEFFNDLVVFGSAQIKDSNYPTISQYNSLLAIVNNLVDRVEALEGA